MDDDVFFRVAELTDRAEGLPNGPAKVALLEEAVRLADAHGDVDAGYHARRELLYAAMMAGRGELLLVHYPWCLAQFDKDPDRFDEYDLLWCFKWVLWGALKFPQISLEQLDGLYADMTRRYRRYGAGRRVLADFRYALAKRRGLVKEAAKHFKKYREQPRDGLSDCEACEASEVVDYHQWVGDHAAAVRAAKPLLDGRMSCSSQPEGTMATALDSLLHLGKYAQAAAVYRQAARLNEQSRDLETAADLVQFLALTDNRAAAVRLFERRLPAAVASFEPEPRFDFLLAGRFLCDRLTATGFARGLRVPADLTSGDRKTTSDVPTLRAWLDAECRTVAAQFDGRNMTDRFARHIEEQARLHDRVRPVPLD